jgi:transposase
MSEELSPEEVAILIRARRIARDKGLAIDADVKTICKHAGISRKTGYQWVKNKFESSADEGIVDEHRRLKQRHEALEKQYDDLRFENEGRKLAWEIHDVDEYLASKKNITRPKKKKKP